MTTLAHLTNMLSHTALLAAALLVTFALLGLEALIVRSSNRAAHDDAGGD